MTDPIPERKHSGRCGDPLSPQPLTRDHLVRRIFQIKPDDVKKVLASKPGKGKKK